MGESRSAFSFDAMTKPKGDNLKAAVTALAGLVLFAVGIARAEEPPVKSLPPSVIKTVPECGNTEVDATATTQIRVTFSKDMMDGGWSWS
jgi:hypothetical protein